MAASLKGSAAALAAFAALVFGAEAAHAGILDPIVEEQAPALVEETLTELTETADEVVADARGAVEETVSEAPGTIEEVAAPLEAVIAQTPANELVSEVKGVVGSVEPAVARAARAAEAPTTTAHIESPGTGAAEAPAGQPPSVVSQASAAEAIQTTTTHQAPPANGSRGAQSPRPARSVSPNLQFGKHTGGPALVQPLSVSLEPIAASVSGAPDDASASTSSRFLGPLAPLVPPKSSATAALVVGAAGGALTAALLCAFVLLAPRTGRLARPGPYLVRAEPCLSLPERPG